MNIHKAELHRDGNRINLSVPFSKIDKENRTVSGFASLDNLDKHGDVVTAEASQKAFDRFRGNLREMHQPLAVGKVLSFIQQNFYDKPSGKTYKGVFVTTYISKGAQDTWEKVLDGTLTGFSIGGNVLESQDEFNKEADKSVRKINDYELYELSLVDNPANPLANIFSIQKGVDGPIYKGSVTEINTENVFWCASDEIAISSNCEDCNCSACNQPMTNIGWIENIENTKSIDLESIVNKYLNNKPKGGTDMSKELSVESTELVKSVDQVEEITAEEVTDETVDALEESDSADETVEETVEDDVVEKSADPAVNENFDFAKALDDLKSIITEKIDVGISKATQNSTAFDSVMSELRTGYEDLTKSVNSLQSRMDAYESSTAVKKSSDSDGSLEEVKIQKSIWKGHFLNVQDL